MKELDVLLERWLERHRGLATAEDLRRFETLLELQDPELARYLLAGQAHPDPGLQGLIDRVRLG
jgi:succinate dehydrogenase flavin-adding protein (antitoxin of CptAB toxin-antitoxin module)